MEIVMTDSDQGLEPKTSSSSYVNSTHCSLSEFIFYKTELWLTPFSHVFAEGSRFSCSFTFYAGALLYTF